MPTSSLLVIVVAPHATHESIKFPKQSALLQKMKKGWCKVCGRSLFRSKGVKKRKPWRILIPWWRGPSKIPQKKRDPRLVPSSKTKQKVGQKTSLVFSLKKFVSVGKRKKVKIQSTTCIWQIREKMNITALKRSDEERRKSELLRRKIKNGGSESCAHLKLSWHGKSCSLLQWLDRLFRKLERNKIYQGNAQELAVRGCAEVHRSFSDMSHTRSCKITHQFTRQEWLLSWRIFGALRKTIPRNLYSCAAMTSRIRRTVAGLAREK
jgi:hypothetical protein